LGEAGRALPLAFLEAGPTGHGVNQEIRDIDAFAETGQAARVGHIATSDLTAATFQMLCAPGIAHQTPHHCAGRQQ
jgi:hypothetical protein